MVHFEGFSKEVVYCQDNSLKQLQKKWYVFYTYPRAEKIVLQELIKRGHDAYLPTYKTLRVWKNRQKKKIEQVLFPGYIFVNTHEFEVFNINRIPKVVNFLNCVGKPSTIPSKEIDSIKRMLDNELVIYRDNKLYKSQKVRIVDGPLAGLEGELVNQKGEKRFGIQLKEINQNVFVEIKAYMLEPINN